jgi:DNA-directed RNA polymerase subunit RPC12/RpoP
MPNTIYIFLPSMGDFTEATKAVNEELACVNCGAVMKFKPGTPHLACPYCGTENEIAQPAVPEGIKEIDLEDFLQNHFKEEEHLEVATVKCDSCGASTTLDPNISSDQCPFCASTLVIKTGTVSSIHKPQYVLPFGITDQDARQRFARWLKGLWFAPSDLKHYADRADRLNGMYLPYWTFDCHTDTNYTGQRGEDYYVTESYSAEENGKTVTRTRQVQKTRWYPASGNVQNAFDDLLIEASQSLPGNLLRSLEPWDLPKLLPYDDKFLSGFRTETYAKDVKHGYQEAKQRMEPIIRETICRDIGGDRQTILYTSTAYNNPTFKHILLPVWVSAFPYQNKIYRFVVNARTGEVQGQRPYSALKIALAVITGLIIIILIIMFAQK